MKNILLWTIVSVVAVGLSACSKPIEDEARSTTEITEPSEAKVVSLKVSGMT